MRKKRILIHSNHYRAFTGFGKHKKNLLSYLFKTGKYELIEFSDALKWDSPQVKLAPWKGFGSLPEDDSLLEEIKTDRARAHAARYGAESIDRVIKEVKPDIYLGIEDIWAYNTFYNKPWWNKVHCLIHTTLDSLPILPEAVEAGKYIKNYFVWASFAERELKRLGHDHVKTVRGTIDSSHFYRLSDDARNRLREFFFLKDSFIIGFVFRNQLRKSVPNLLDGFELFRKNNPESKAKLLLHTNWSEGWDIPRLLKEKSIDPSNILTTYLCGRCENYHVRSFVGQGIKCPFCSSPNSCKTINIEKGVSEKQLNEIYNLMDVYCHPFTSGGQEIPIQEAKLTELITLVTNYSCGEDMCSEESGGLPLQWAEYREPGTQFIKASTSPQDICNKIAFVFNSTEDQKREMGTKARNFILENFTIEKVGRFFEELFDSLEYVCHDDSFFEKKDIDVSFVPDGALNNEDWVKSLYENMLGELDKKGVEHWADKLEKGASREDVYSFFLKSAAQKYNEQTREKMIKSLSPDDEGRRIAFVMPEDERDLVISLSLIDSIADLYPDHNIYFFTNPKYYGLISHNRNIHKILPYCAAMDNALFFEGEADGEKHFELAYIPYLETKIYLNFTKNSKDKIST